MADCRSGAAGKAFIDWPSPALAEGGAAAANQSEVLPSRASRGHSGHVSWGSLAIQLLYHPWS
ncbi:MAG: hypothetical protein V2I33_21945, partial [Kangiellaceae bacterium]|nr:hypothetical protein [Kangiellaceae bacterium]